MGFTNKLPSVVEDLERNNGQDRPYFMSKKLQSLLNVKNKVDQPDIGDVHMESIEGFPNPTE